MNLTDILSKYDVVDKRFNCNVFLADINSLPEVERQKDEYRFEWLAFMLQPNDSDHTFGGYFGPQFILSNQQGNPVYVPELSMVTPDAVFYWELRYRVANNPFMKMRYAGLVWDFKPRIAMAKYDSDLYRTYVDSMLEVCNNDHTSHPVITTLVLERLFSIASKQQDDLEKAKDAMRNFENRHATDSSVRYWSCQFLLMTYNKKRFTQDEIDDLLKQHEERMKRLAAGNPNGSIDIWTLDSECKLLADFYLHSQLKDDIARVMKVSEDAHKKSFDPRDPLQKLAILNDLHRKYTYYGLNDDAKRLLSEIQQAGNQTASTLATHEYEFTIPQSVYEQAEEMFGKKATSDWRIRCKLTPLVRS